MITAEQFMTAQKSSVEVLFGLTAKTFEGVEKLVELNLQTARTALGEAAETTRAAFSVKGPQEFLTLQSGYLQPAVEKAAAYSRQVYEIAASTSAEVAKVAESTASEAQAKFIAVVDSAVKNAPAGTENVVAFVKSAVTAASNAMEGVQKASKQAADVAEANFQALSTTAARATQQAAAKVKRAA